MSLEEEFKEAIEEFPGTVYYESGYVGKTRKEKTCNVCYGDIKKGSKHDYYKFYGDGCEFPTFNVCNKCKKKYSIQIDKMTDGKYNIK